MSAEPASALPAEENIVIDLRDPYLAAFLAWLWPGAGHLYQGRWRKGILFMVCILTTFGYGLMIGSCRVVYASMREHDKRWYYFCQLGVGLPAMPALVQSYRQNNHLTPWISDDFMVPPANVLPDKDSDDVSKLNYDYHRFFELGGLFTMVAGLLNVFAIFDAWGGPVFITDKPPGPKTKPESQPPPEKKD